MTNQELYQRALDGDMAAGRELIERCRVGMVVPYWEESIKPTDAHVEKHLKRRQKIGTASS